METVRIVIGILCCSVLLSCTLPSDAAKNNPAIILEYPSVTIGKNSGAFVGIKGGAPPFSVKSTSDSSIVELYVDNDVIRSRYRLYLRNSGTLGSAIVVIQDSSGNTASVSVTVTEMALYPSFIEVKENSSASVSILGGTPPYSLVEGYDTSVVSVFCTSYLDVTGKNAGATTVTIMDSSPQRKQSAVTVTVRSRMSQPPGNVSFQSMFGSHSFTRTSVPTVYPQDGSDVYAFGWQNWSGSYELAICIGTNIIHQGTELEGIVLTITSSGKVLTPGIYPLISNPLVIDPVFSNQQASISYTRMQFAADTISGWTEYSLTEGQVMIASVQQERIQGIFSGSGFMRRMDDPDVDSAMTFSIVNGTFDIPYNVSVDRNQAEPGAIARIARQELSRGELFLAKYLR